MRRTRGGLDHRLLVRAVRGCPRHMLRRRPGLERHSNAAAGSEAETYLPPQFMSDGVPPFSSFTFTKHPRGSQSLCSLQPLISPHKGGRCVGPNLWARAMQDVEKHRSTVAPRAAEELRTALRHDGGDSTTQGALSEEASCSATNRAQSLGIQERICSCCSWRRLPFLRRISTRPSYAAVLLCLAGAFSLRGWRAAMMIESAPFGVVRWSTSSDQLRLDDDEGSNQCDWEPSGSLMFNVQHSKQHADGESW